MTISARSYDKPWHQCSNNELKQATKKLKIAKNCKTKAEYVKALEGQECLYKLGFSDLQVWQLREAAKARDISIKGRREELLKALENEQFGQGDYEIYKKPRLDAKPANNDSKENWRRNDRDPFVDLDPLKSSRIAMHENGAKTEKYTVGFISSRLKRTSNALLKDLQYQRKEIQGLNQKANDLPKNGMQFTKAAFLRGGIYLTEKSLDRLIECVNESIKNICIIMPGEVGNREDSSEDSEESGDSEENEESEEGEDSEESEDPVSKSTAESIYSQLCKTWTSIDRNLKRQVGKTEKLRWKTEDLEKNNGLPLQFGYLRLTAKYIKLAQERTVEQLNGIKENISQGFCQSEESKSSESSEREKARERM